MLPEFAQGNAAQMFVGHGAVRKVVVGMDNRAPNVPLTGMKRKGEPDYRGQFEKFALNYEGSLIPLQQLVTTWLAWAQVVPETKPGPQ